MRAEDFEIKRVLGRGSTSVVELAEGKDGGLYALKRLAVRGSATEITRAARRLRREAEVLERLNHPNICPLIEHFDDGADIVLVMPFLEDGSLAERCQSEGPIKPEGASSLCRVLLEAIEYAHSKDVLHRDISPRNVLFSGSEAYLSDFGIAADGEATAGLTQVGTVLGTPTTISPEQARGEESSEASDLFSIAATVLWAIGSPIYGTGPASATTLKASRGDIAPVPYGLPSNLRRALRSMLAPLADDRPTATEALELLGDTTSSTLEAVPIVSPSVSPAEGKSSPAPETDQTKPNSRKRLAFAALAVAVLAGITGIGIWAANSTEGSDPGLGSQVADGEVADDATTTTECADLPYQPCGNSAAPNTDGTNCLGDFDDYDEDATNGCEAAPSGEQITELSGSAPISANLVPADDVDTYELEVVDNAQILCNGQFEVGIRAAPQTRQKLTLKDPDGSTVASVTSDGTTTEAIAVAEERCGTNDGGTYELVVESVGTARSRENYVLTTSGSF